MTLISIKKNYHKVVQTYLLLKVIIEVLDMADFWYKMKNIRFFCFCLYEFMFYDSLPLLQIDKQTNKNTTSTFFSFRISPKVPPKKPKQLPQY